MKCSIWVKPGVFYDSDSLTIWVKNGLIAMDILEHVVRRFIRENCADIVNDLVWIEAARGGSVGTPDVTIPVSTGQIPTELKVWTRGRRKNDRRIRFEVRPSQRRYHRLASAKGKRTAFVAWLSDGDNGGTFIAIPGAALPMETVVEDEPKIWEITNDIGSIVKLFESKQFWNT